MFLTAVVRYAHQEVNAGPLLGVGSVHRDLTRVLVLAHRLLAVGLLYSCATRTRRKNMVDGMPLAARARTEAIQRG